MALLQTIGTALNFIPVVGPVASSLVTSATTSDPETGRVSKSDFYAQRDAWYAQIFAAYGEDYLSNMPGKPFHQFSHDAIADSPFKNYASNLADLTAAMKKYFPEIMGLPATTPPAQQPAPKQPAPSETNGATAGRGVPAWVWIVGGIALLFLKKK